MLRDRQGLQHVPVLHFLTRAVVLDASYPGYPGTLADSALAGQRAKQKKPPGYVRTWGLLGCAVLLADGLDA